jgi:hypothetical protein
MPLEPLGKKGRSPRENLTRPLLALGCFRHAVTSEIFTSVVKSKNGHFCLSERLQFKWDSYKLHFQQRRNKPLRGETCR